LKQERLDELMYLALMNADHLPDENLTSPMTEFWNMNRKDAKSTKENK
jgi:hypothetical protein